MTKDISRRAYVDEAPPIIGEIVDLVVKGADYRSHAMTILADAKSALKRAASRAAALPEEYERVEIKQSEGWTFDFTGRLLAGTDFAGTERGPQGFELWETMEQRWVAVTHYQNDSSALVIEPDDDRVARRKAALDHWRWHERARSMAARKLKWPLRIEVE